jgi:hypothetical protein
MLTASMHCGIQNAPLRARKLQRLAHIACDWRRVRRDLRILHAFRLRPKGAFGRRQEAQHALQQVQGTVEGRVVAPILDQAAGMGDGSSVASSEHMADLGQSARKTTCARYMATWREGRRRPAARLGPQVVTADGEAARHGMVEELSHERCVKPDVKLEFCNLRSQR